MNFNIWKDKVGIPVFGRIRWEFQCLEVYGQNCNVGKDIVRIPMFGRVRSEPFKVLNFPDSRNVLSLLPPEM